MCETAIGPPPDTEMTGIYRPRPTGTHSTATVEHKIAIGPPQYTKVIGIDGEHLPFDTFVKSYNNDV